MTKDEDWDDLKRDFRRVVAMRRQEQTIDEVAATIPMDRANLYRLLSGEIKKPGLATRDCIERFVAKGERLIEKAAQMRRPPEPPEADAPD